MKKDREINFTVQDVAKRSVDFTSLKSLYKFCRSESKFWSSKKEKTTSGHPFFNVHVMFDQFISQLDVYNEQGKFKDWDDATLNQTLNQLKSQKLRTLGQSWLWSGHSYTDAFIDCSESNGDTAATAFIDYIAHSKTPSVATKEHFDGYLCAYEFVNQDSDLLKRRKSEKAAISRLKRGYLESQDKLFLEVDELKQGFTDWNQDSKEESKRLYKIQKYLGERKVREQGHSFARRLNDWESSVETWKSNVSTLEETYQEKLRLKKPAEYWAKAATRYSRQGYLWSFILGLVVCIGIISFQDIFVAWLMGKKIPLQLASFQGILLFGTIAALYAFALKSLSRLAFSSFHLMRDAEEREQLTYLYLSLTNEAVIDEGAREIVLQALFSRTETGLLTNEHGPTMPSLASIAKFSGKAKG